MRNYNNDGYEKECDEFDFVYEQALLTVQAIDEVRKLRRENEYLREELSKGDRQLYKQYKQSISHVGNILNGLMDRAEKENDRKYE